MPRDGKGDPAFIYDILKAAAELKAFISEKTEADYQASNLLQAAVERKIEIVGEAARGLSQAFRDANPSIPWRKIIATRNILVHDYDDVNQATVWRIATVHVPELAAALAPHLPPIPPDPQPEN